LIPSSAIEEIDFLIAVIKTTIPFSVGPAETLVLFATMGIMIPWLVPLSHKTAFGLVLVVPIDTEFCENETVEKPRNKAIMNILGEDKEKSRIGE
jgi:hypothetical protein